MQGPPRSPRLLKPDGTPDWHRIWRPAAVAVAVLLVLIVAFTSYFTVAPEGRAVVKRFGAVVAVRDPGLHLKFPLGIDTATFVPTERVLKEEFGFRTVSPGQRSRFAKPPEAEQESLMLTGDLNVIDVEWVVQYRIRDPEQWLHEVRDQTGTIRAISESVMRRIVGNRLGSDVLTVGRVEIANEVRDEMQRILDDYEMGAHVIAIELQDVTPPDPVKDAFNEVNEARQQKERLINVAEKERNQIIPRARGEAEQIIAEAEAYAAERVNVARGASSRFKAQLEAYNESKEVTRRRLYLEAIDEIAKGLGGIYVLGEGAPSPLPLFDLQGSRARTTPTTPQEGSR